MGFLSSAPAGEPRCTNGPGHYTDAGGIDFQDSRVALEAGAQKLLIGHYSSRNAEISAYEAECRTLFPETYATSDGDSYEI